MEDQKIFRMALIVTLVGIVGMLFFADDVSPREIKIKEMDQSMLDQDVTVEVYVEKIDKARSSNTYFLRVNDGTGKSTVVIFEGTINEMEKGGFKLNMVDKRRIRITGTVTEYKGHMELILNDQKSLKLL